MNITWEEWISSLGQDGAQVLATELKDFLKTSLVDSNTFVRQQAKRVEAYVRRLASGDLDKEQFESHMEDLADLSELYALKESVRAKVSVQRFMRGLRELVLERLLFLLS